MIEQRTDLERAEESAVLFLEVLTRAKKAERERDALRYALGSQETANRTLMTQVADLSADKANLTRRLFDMDCALDDITDTISQVR